MRGHVLSYIRRITAAAQSRGINQGTSDRARKIFQCDIRVGTVIVARMPRVAPPRMNSRNLQCPYPPITMKSAEVSAAWDRIAFGTSKSTAVMFSTSTFG